MGIYLQKRSDIPITQTDEDSDIFKTGAPLGYITNKNEFIHIRSDYKTDGYSKPLVTKSLVDGSFGDDLRPAVIHDYLCEYRGYHDKAGNFFPITFKRANDIFLEAMKDAGLSFSRRWLYRIAVSFNPNKW